MNKKLKIVLLCLFSVVFLVSLIQVARYFIERRQSRTYYADLVSIKDFSPPSPTPVISAAPSASAVVQSPAAATAEPETIGNEAYRALYERNPDFIGWVKIDGTNIDYPVMQNSEDDEYYLYRNFDGEEDNAGTPFLDGRCSIEPRSMNLLLHGHNMKDGSMFHNLRYYKEKEYYRSHPIIRFDTLKEEGLYQIIAVLETRVLYADEEGFRYYNFLEADSEEEFNTQLSSMMALSSYDTGHTAQYGDQLLTVSTCDYTLENGRLAVIAKKIS